MVVKEEMIMKYYFDRIVYEVVNKDINNIIYEFEDFKQLIEKLDI
jgi:hypothetical protein